jgi:hypothetical protein
VATLKAATHATTREVTGPFRNFTWTSPFFPFLIADDAAPPFSVYAQKSAKTCQFA